MTLHHLEQLDFPIDVAISPHLDDAVLSLGGVLDGTRVVTVLAGIPPVWPWPSPFDSASGFTRSDVAVATRRMEDRNALMALACEPVHLEHLDGQYRIDRDEGQLRTDIAKWMSFDGLAVPLGLVHPDHRYVAKTCREAAQFLELDDPFLVYADLPGAVLEPGHVAGALRGWLRAGFHLEPCAPWPIDLERKTRAVELYCSQRRFPELAFDNLTEEHGWIAHRVTG